MDLSPALQPPRIAEALPLALVARGAMAPADAARVMARTRHPDAHLLTTLRLATEPAILSAQAALTGMRRIDPAAAGPDPVLAAALPPETLYRLGAVPLGRSGTGLRFALSDAAALPAIAAAAERAGLGPARACRGALAPAAAIRAALDRIAAPRLAAEALRSVPARMSCRALGQRNAKLRFGALAGLLAAFATLAPRAALMAAILFTCACLLATSTLRLAAAVAAQRRPDAPPPRPARRLPVISMLVPLYREGAVSGRLLARLRRLDYPRDRLDLRLVVEADDALTAAALARADLPGWITVVRVAPGPVRTKPRALNVALAGCRGEIVGIWDAEDAPAPDQLHRVADAFESAPPEVACLQGRLAFAARGRGWIARCFALEYEAWFRVVLPGLARLGLAVPLGGTTLFFRRGVLRELGAWDAHNVTEDADLGIRLHRAGWRTQLIDTRTLEEPNTRPIPWIRQRSRWLKGYAVTWLVHGRRPWRLVREAGLMPAIGVHVLLLGTVVQFALAPVLWLFWLAALPHGGPVADLLPPAAFWAFTGLFVGAEAVSLTLLVMGARLAGRARDAWLAPTMLLYFPMATAAAWKALGELIFAPHYWDKTHHG